MNLNLHFPVPEQVPLVQEFLDSHEENDDLSFDQFAETLLTWLDANHIEYQIVSDQEYDLDEQTQH